ncbi:MAG TPA: PD-(D/E)XK nuclease family protein, partial [Acidimicrobiales bacterium]
ARPAPSAAAAATGEPAPPASPGGPRVAAGSDDGLPPTQAAQADPDDPADGDDAPVAGGSATTALRRQADRTRDLRRRVLALIDGIGEARARPATWSARVAWLRALLAQVGGGTPLTGAWPADEVRAAERIEAALDRLAGLDPVDDPPPLDVFRRTVELELDADLGRVGRFGEGVLVGPLSYAVGLDLDLVVVLGLAEGTLPAPVRDDSLLPDAERARTGGDLPLRRDRVGREHRRLLAALASAEHHLLCLPRGDLRATSERVPSRWALDVASALRAAHPPEAGPAPWLDTVPSFAHGIRHVAFPATEQEYRLRAGASAAPDPLVARGDEVIRARRGQAFTRFDGNLAGVGLPSPVDGVVSSTRLESWTACPFAYFGRRLLGVEPVDDPEAALAMSAMDRGALVHDVLERFIVDVLARPPERRPGPDDPWTADDRVLLRRITEQVCDDYHDRGLTGRPVFWRRDRSQILAQVDRFLDDDADKRRASRATPIAAEYAFGRDASAPPVGITLADGRTLRFRGSADRIDATSDGRLVVLDYKTGRPDEYRRLGPDNPDDRGTKLQLVVYAQAARAAVGRPDARVDAQYWFVSERGGFARLGYEVDEAVLGRVVTTLGTIVDGIERGAFPPHPDDQFRPWVVCPWCDPDGMGVAELRRQWERKRHDPAVAPYAELVEPTEPTEPAEPAEPVPAGAGGPS